MKLLAIDTTTRFLSLAAYDGSKIYEYNLELGPKLSAKLAPAITRVLGALKWQARDVDYFACGLGPGSFTGLRVGMSTIKGLAWPQNKPIAGVPTLDVLARNALFCGTSLVVPVIDAKRNLVYACVYRRHNDSLKRIAPYMLLGIDELLSKLRKLLPKSKSAVLLGDGAGLYGAAIEASGLNLTILSKDHWNVEPRYLIQAALEKIKENKLENAFGIQPVYLYPKECQVRAHKAARVQV